LRYNRNEGGGGGGGGGDGRKGCMITNTAETGEKILEVWCVYQVSYAIVLPYIHGLEQASLFVGCIFGELSQKKKTQLGKTIADQTLEDREAVHHAKCSKFRLSTGHAKQL
jgi:hypothetical protein